MLENAKKKNRLYQKIYARGFSAHLRTHQMQMIYVEMQIFWCAFTSSEENRLTMVKKYFYRRSKEVKKYEKKKIVTKDTTHFPLSLTYNYLIW